MGAWNGWYHCMSHTYGTWLPGDPRGFRTRDHREHIEGDYRNPPTEDFSERLERARRLLKREPVVLSLEARRAAVAAVVHAMVTVHHVEVLAVSVDRVHLHVLGRFGSPRLQRPTPTRRGLRERDPARYFVGIAKERSAKALTAAGLVRPGRVWATRGKIKPIADRTHQIHVLDYILAHANQGAAVWDFMNQNVRMPSGF